MTSRNPEELRPSLASLLLRTSIFWVAVPGSVFVLAPVLILRASGPRWTAAAIASRVAGVTLVTVGGAVMLWCAVDFVLRGWGTAAPYDPPRRLVTGRLYSWVRNPMYEGGTLILTGETLAFRAPALALYMIVVWILWHLAIVFVEEPALRRRFGAGYKDYARRVPRWIPRLRQPRRSP